MYVNLWRRVFSNDSLRGSKLKATSPHRNLMPEMLTLTLPDGATRQVEEGTLPRDVVGSIGQRLLRDALAVEVDGEVQDLITPLRKSGVVPRSDREGSEGARRPSPFRRAHSCHGGPPASPGRKDRIRALRSKTASTTTSKSRSRSRPKISRSSSRRCERSSPRSFRSSAKKSARPKRARNSADDPLKLERLSRVQRRRDHLDLYRRSVHRSVPRPARSGHLISQAFQAPSYGRRLLARR